MNGRSVMVVGIIVALIGIAGGYLYYYPPSDIIVTHESISPIEYMGNIPPKPDDWKLIKRELESGWVNIREMDRAYWIQPDFYPSWTVAKSFYENHDYSRWGVYGYGMYPGNPEMTFNTNKTGEWIRDTTLLKTGYGIETWQGIKLVAENNEYFDVRIEPNELLLEPTFPVFNSDWVKLIEYTVTIKKEPPSGVYEIKILNERPSAENAERWFWEVLKREALPEEQDMIVRAKLQADAEGRIPAEFEEMIKVGRKNKYVSASQFSVNARMVIKVVIK